MLQSIKDVLGKIGALSNLILLVIASIFASLFYFEEKKAASNKELLKNDEVNKQVAKLDNTISSDQSTLSAEADKRKTLDSNLSKDQNATVNNEDLAKFLSDIPDDNK